MKQKSIISMLIAVMLLCSCTTVRTYKVQGTPGCKVSLQSVDSLRETTLDASGQGNIQWTTSKNIPLPTYLFSTNQSSLVIPIGMDYKDFNNYGSVIGLVETTGGVEMFAFGFAYTIVGSTGVGIPLLLGSAGCLVDGIRRLCSSPSDYDNNMEFLPIHTNDDMRFSMEPSRPSGEPKMKRTAEAKQTKGQTNTASKKTSATQVSKANDNAFYHTVEQGEKLSDIAKNYGVTMAEIIRANNLNSNNIQPGQKLIIPM